VRKDFHLHGVRAFKLPHSAPTVGNGQTTWAGFGAVNILLGGQITLPGGQNVFVWTTHLNDSSSAIRQDQVNFALDAMASQAQAAGQDWAHAWVIFAGDLNSAPESAEQGLLRGQLQDNWLVTHPGDPGYTLVDDVTDKEYNPMVHGAGLFPSQYGPQGTERIDYSYVHIPRNFGVTTTRVFTAPLNNTWMSDHFGLFTTYDFTGRGPGSSPSADSDFSLEPTQALTLVSKDQLPLHQDFSAAVAKGFTLINTSDDYAMFSFISGKKNVYTSSHVAITKGETASFSFFAPGDYNYALWLGDREMSGTVHVHH
jgi:hypothetical protein